MTERDIEEWTCPHCGSTDPHREVELYPDFETERFVADITCKSVYLDHEHVDGMLALEDEDMERLIEAYREERE